MGGNLVSAYLLKVLETGWFVIAVTSEQWHGARCGVPMGGGRPGKPA